MSRPLFEVADLVAVQVQLSSSETIPGSAGPISRSCWPSHAVAPPHSAAISMSAPAADIVPPSPTTVAATGIARSVRPGARTLDPSPSSRTAPLTLCPCRVYSAAATGCAGSAKQKSDLWFVASGQRRNTPGSRSQPQTSWRRDRLLQRASYLEPETPTSSSCTLCCSRRRTLRDHARWIRSRPRFFLPIQYCGVCFVASSSPA